MSKPEDFLGVFELNPQKRFGLEVGVAVMPVMPASADEDLVRKTPEGFPLVARNFQSVGIPGRLVYFVLGSPITVITKRPEYYICINKTGETIAVENLLWENTVKQKLQRATETTITQKEKK